MKKEHYFEIRSSDEKKIYIKKWSPSIPPKAIIQVVHGMAEHVERYNKFAEFFTKNGLIVYAHDQRGHGKTAEPGKLGFFAPKKGWKLVIDDVERVSEIIKKENPQLPIFLLGHSMGSLISRAHILKNNIYLNGVIFSGTSGLSGLIIPFGKFIALLQGVFKDKTKPSKLMTNLSFGSYNKPFKPTKTPFDWLSRDDQMNMEYWKDKFCGFTCSNRFFFDLLSIISYINKKTNSLNIPKTLPMFLLSGSMDPVGDFGKDVKKIYNKYRNLGVENIKIKLYEGGRHEMLNETNRNEVYNDIKKWIKENIPKT